MRHLSPDQRDLLFNNASADILVAAVRGEISLLDEVRRELCDRGNDQNGRYVGLTRAETALKDALEAPLQARIAAALAKADSGSAVVGELAALLREVSEGLPARPLFVVAACSGGHVNDLARDYRPMSDANGDGVEMVRVYTSARDAAEDAEKYSPGYAVRGARIFYGTGRAGEYAVDLEIDSGGGTYQASQVLDAQGLAFGGVSLMQAALPFPVV